MIFFKNKMKVELGISSYDNFNNIIKIIEINKYYNE
jgi:hypothetical protein